MVNFDIYEKKKRFDSNEIKVTDLSEQEIMKINEIYSKEIEELQLKIKTRILELSKK